jgi:hypothetical protein
VMWCEKCEEDATELFDNVCEPCHENAVDSYMSGQVF